MKLVERLVDLTFENLATKSNSSPATGNEFAHSMSDKFRREQIELRMKYFEPEQVEALLKFYDSAMGRSILQNQAKIDHDLANNVSIISDEVRD